MSFVHSRHTVVLVNSVNISQYVTQSSDLNTTTDTHEVTAYGKRAKVYDPGLDDGTFELEGTYDNTAVTGPRAVFTAIQELNARVPIIRRPEGTGTGLPQDSFDGVLSGYDESAPVGDMVTWSASFQVSDEIDRTAQS